MTDTSPQQFVLLIALDAMVRALVLNHPKSAKVRRTFEDSIAQAMATYPDSPAGRKQAALLQGFADQLTVGMGSVSATRRPTPTTPRRAR